MMKKRWIFLAGWLVAGGCLAGAGNEPEASTEQLDRIIQSFRNAKDGKVLVAAHRGDFRHYPENAISSIVSAANYGADIVEVDVRATKDHRLVLMHDWSIDRTTNGKGKVSRMTVAQLKQFRLKGLDGNLTDETIPTLEEALEALRGKCIINIDKSAENLEMCVAVVKRMGMEHQVIMKGARDLRFTKETLDVLGSKSFYSPIVVNADTSSNDQALKDLRQSIEVFKPEMIELVFFQEDSSLISSTALKLAEEDDVRLWINSLFENHGAGHVDRKALIDPDANWGWLVKHGAGIIQTDESFALLEYLRSKGLHD